MDFETWAPVYRAILRDMGFSEKDDETAAAFIAEAENASVCGAADALEKRIKDRPALVCGNAPCLVRDIRTIREKNGGAFPADTAVIAADGAAVVLAACGIVPDIVVTDLDGRAVSDPEAEIRLANAHPDLLMLIHAHGDNKHRLEKYLPMLDTFIATCQCRPPAAHVFNFGGFSDGDRCLFLADAFGASEIGFAGFDFEDGGVTPVKKKKLEWAKKLIDERRRENPRIGII